MATKSIETSGSGTRRLRAIGAGNVRATIRRSTKRTRDFLILINRTGDDVGSLAPDIEAILASAAGFSTTGGDTLTIREFTFASGAMAGPEATEIGELGVIGILVFLLAWGAFAPPKTDSEMSGRTKLKRSNETRPQRTRPVAVDLSEPSNSKTASAAQAATEDPAGTAKVIQAWMRSPEAPR